MALTTEQSEVLQDVWNWLHQPKTLFFRVGGYAGTGKTTWIAALRWVIAKKHPEWNVAFAAYTGKAAEVLRGKLQKLPGGVAKGDSISTLHGLLYQPIVGAQGRIDGWRRRDELAYNVIVIDEASMIPSDIWQDVLRFRVPVVAVGDHGQLPPIGDSHSLMEEPERVLTQIHRQVADSPILEVATLARTTGQVPVGKYGPGVEKIDMANSEAMVRIDEFYQTWNPQTLFIVGRNKTRLAINHSVRSVLGRLSDQPESGDRVICLRNNWQKGIYNGMTGTLQSVQPVRGDDGDVRSYEAEVVGDDGSVFYSGLMAAEQFLSEATLDLSKKEREVRGELFDFGYALTAHKAQGSQAKRVIVIEERTQHMSDEDWRRWLYTAVTRAEEELYVFGSSLE